MWELRKQRAALDELELPISPRAPVAGDDRRPILLKTLTGRSQVSRKEAPEETPPGPLAVRWAEVSGETFQVRGQDYMRSRRKEGSGASIYRFLGADLFAFERKIYHIAHHIDLPPSPTLGAACEALPAEERLPPVMIINLQLPSYAPTLFGKHHDGPGFSLVLYFALPEGWAPEQVPNRAALELFQRFVHDGVESDGCATRDRLKLIPHVVNPDEWSERAPLSRYETKLLKSYADKPILSRPQHTFFVTQRYTEIDIDVHNYAYLARKALHSFLGRFQSVTFDLGLVVQGNAEDELPELVFGAARLWDVRLDVAQPFKEVEPQELDLTRLSPSLSRQIFGDQIKRP